MTVPKWITAFIFCFFLINTTSAIAEIKEVTLRSGVPVLLSLKQEINGKNMQAGDIVKFAVVRPVKVDDMVVVDANTEAIGKITEIKKARGWGKKGEISMNVNSTTAVDGTEVLLNAYQKREGNSHGAGATTLAATTGVLLCPLLAPTGFLIKGEDGSFPIGYEVKAYTDEEVKIKVDTSRTAKAVTNIAPLASAGIEQSAKVNDLVVLDGSKSSDIDGNKLYYSWKFASVPSGSTVTLENPTTVNPTFKPDVPGVYIINLIVNDGSLNSEPSNVSVNVSALNDGVFK
ncbi:MAG: hypothetical protein HRF42_00495 [Candidatus Brocadia sp.]|jgi:hypothetical protein